jgi:hypothetical protein
MLKFGPLPRIRILLVFAMFFPNFYDLVTELSLKTLLFSNKAHGLRNFDKREEKRVYLAEN